MTYKKKFNILIIGLIIMLFLSYFLALKKTFALYSECSNMTQKLKTIGEAPAKINELKQKIEEIDNLISTNDTTIVDFRQTLLEKTGDFCAINNITLKDFPASIITIQNDYLIETNILSVEGTFPSLVKFTYMLEQKQKIGKIISSDFSSKYDLASKKTKLIEKIYIQNIKRTTNEK